jgi:hypothetical protein
MKLGLQSNISTYKNNWPWAIIVAHEFQTGREWAEVFLICQCWIVPNSNGSFSSVISPYSQLVKSRKSIHHQPSEKVGYYSDTQTLLSDGPGFENLFCSVIALNLVIDMILGKLFNSLSLSSLFPLFPFLLHVCGFKHHL